MTDVKHRINTNPDGSYMDADQIFQDIIDHRLNADIVELLRWDFDPPGWEAKLANQYAWIEFGRWIRNSYGLWREDNPHTSAKWDGGPDSPFHPDNFSAAIIDRLVAHYQLAFDIRK